jgi:hypothetical protein
VSPRIPGTYSMPRTRTTAGAGRLAPVAVPTPTAQLPGQHRAYRSESGCGAIVALEPAKAAPAGIWIPPGELELWHLSVSHPDRYPTWDEMADVRYELVPDEVTMALLLPPRAEYVNAHEHCFHLWQIDDRRAA